MTSGEHCEEGSYSNTGKLSNTISGDKVTGTMTYSTSAYGTLFSAEGEFELKKQ